MLLEFIHVMYNGRCIADIRIRTNKDEILVNDILLSKDIVTATNYVLEMNSHNNETGDGF